MSSGKSQLLGPNGQPLPVGIGKAVAALAGGRAEMGLGLGGQRGGGGRQEMAGWMAAQTSADSAWLWNRDDLVAKTRDLVANEPWAQGAVDRKVDMVAGASLRPLIRPDADMLGISPEEAAALGKAFERGWRLWGEDPLCRCDLEQTVNAGWMFSIMATEMEVAGDAAAVLRVRKDRGWPFKTALQLIDADRLSNPNMAMDTPTLAGGVEKNADGAPVAYHFRNAHPGDVLRTGTADLYTWTRVPRREAWGRPVVLHAFRKDRPGQTRGVSRLVAGLARFKQMARFAQAELSNAVINALFAATITSGFDPAVMQQELTSSAIAGYHDLRNAYYTEAAPVLEGSRIQHLFPGDELKFLTSAREAGSFDQFARTFLRSIASGTGIAYEQIAMDWSQVNYSSARAALIEVWRGIQRCRANLVMMAAQPLLLAICEDAVEAGLVTLPPSAPDLYEAPAAYLRGRWIGPARGWVDPVKEPAGALMQIEAGMGNWEDLAADQGIDWDQNIAALADQKQRWIDAGLTPPALRDMLVGVQTLDTPEAPEAPPAQP